MAPMTSADVDWCIDTLRRSEDIIGEFKRQAYDRNDYEAARTFEACVREIFGVRQLLEAEKVLLKRLLERIGGTPSSTIDALFEKINRKQEENTP